MEFLGRQLRSYSFLLAMGGVALLAWVMPGYGRFIDQYGASKIAIIAFFLLPGMTVRLDTLHGAVRNWRCHAAIQAFIFIICPLVICLGAFWLPQGPILYGVFLVAVLPTTMSSSIAFTAAGGGNALTAILNAVGSNFLGIALSPLLLGLLLGATGIISFQQVARTMLDMCLLVMIPFCAGQLLVRLWPRLRRDAESMQVGLLQFFVLLLSYCAFSKSLDQVASQFEAMWKCFIYLALMHLTLFTFSRWLAEALRLPEEDQIAMTFCSTQKTLAFGMPIAYSFFAHTPVPLTLIVLPLIFHYLFQMFPAAVLANQLREAKAKGGSP
jgi:sodium/bile acid cotransporter 7